MTKFKHVLDYMLMFLLPAKVCSYISTHPGLPHQKLKHQTIEA